LDFKTVEKVANFNDTMLIMSMVLSILLLHYDQGILRVPSPLLRFSHNEIYLLLVQIGSYITYLCSYP